MKRRKKTRMGGTTNRPPGGWPCIHCGGTHKAANGPYYCKSNPDGPARRAREAVHSAELWHERGFETLLKEARARDAHRLSEISRKNMLKMWRSKRPNGINTPRRGVDHPNYGVPRPPHVRMILIQNNIRRHQSKKNLEKAVEKHDVITPFMPTAFDSRFPTMRNGIEDEFSIGEIADRIFDGDFDGF